MLLFFSVVLISGLDQTPTPTPSVDIKSVTLTKALWLKAKKTLRVRGGLVLNGVKVPPAGTVVVLGRINPNLPNIGQASLTKAGLWTTDIKLDPLMVPCDITASVIVAGIPTDKTAQRKVEHITLCTP